MPKYLTIEEAQQQLPDLPNELVAEPAIITQDGKPAIVAMSLEQFESLLDLSKKQTQGQARRLSHKSYCRSLLETIDIIAEREFMAQLREGIRQADGGETISL
jgi:PHD/YefM family antitoxin component YafN of YafNO toxin-antitoxin module